MYVPLTLDDLEATERLLVRAARARPATACCGGADGRWAEVEAALCEAPERAAGRVAAWALRGALALLDDRLRAGDDGASGCRVAVDEARLLAAVALLQAGRAGEADQILRWVAPAARVRGRALDRLAEVAQALLSGGQALPVRWAGAAVA